MLRRRVEAQVVEQQVDAAQGEPPARVGSLVALEHSTSMASTASLSAQNSRSASSIALRAAVALDLALVGVELERQSRPSASQGARPRP